MGFNPNCQSGVQLLFALTNDRVFLFGAVRLLVDFGYTEYNHRMQIPKNLKWDLSVKEAIEQQRALAAQVREQNDFPEVRHVAGVDAGFEENNTISRAAAVVLSFPELKPVESAVARQPVTFPYVPGLLAYREAPVVLDALAQLKVEPEVIIVDGQGRAHPRRFGIASHLGVLLDRATIGCAKSILVGRADPPENRVGAWTPLLDKGETIGAALRTRVNVAAVYVSVGNKIDLATAMELVLQCCRGVRVPETTRYAHLVAGGKPLPVEVEQRPLF